MPPKRVRKMYPRRRTVGLKSWEGAPPPIVRRKKSLRYQRVPIRRPRRQLGPVLRSLAKGVGLLLVAGLVLVGVYSLYTLLPTRAHSTPALYVSEVAPLPPRYPGPQLLADYSLTHTVKSGESFEGILQQYGFSGNELQALQAAAQTAGAKAGLSLRKGQRIELSVKADGGLDSIRSDFAPGSTIEVAKSQAGEFNAQVSRASKEPRERIAVGRIERSFANAARSAGIDYRLVDDLVDLFSGRVSFSKDFQKGDRFTLIYQDRAFPDGSHPEPGPILAAALQINGKQLVAIRYVGSDGKPRYYNEKGEVLGDTFLRYPLKFSRISSHFTKSRFHPVLKRSRPHNGTDFAAPIGTPVRTVADGKVIQAGRRGGSGIMLKIQHTDRFTTAYLHLQKIAPGIKQGSRVTRGQVVGAVGMTGLSTGPHLHYELWDRGKHVDPLKVQLPNVEGMSGATRISQRYLRRVLYSLHHYQKVDLKHFYWG